MAKSSLLAGVVAVLVNLAGALPAQAQPQPPDGTTVARIEFEGLVSVSEGFLRRVIGTRPGQPYAADQIQQDIRDLLLTRKFVDVVAVPQMDNGQAVVRFVVQEKPEIASVQLIGNKAYGDDELFKLLDFSAGAVLDRFEIRRGVEAIRDKYREDGYYYAEAQLDEAALNQDRTVVVRIVEGPQVRVKRITFEGARAFPEPRLFFMVQTETYLPILRKGAFDEDRAERDVIVLQDFYRKQGYLDARVGYRLDFDSIDRTELTVVFVVEEGDLYRIDAIELRGNEAFSTDELMADFEIAVGDAYLDADVQREASRIRDLYGEIGYVEVGVQPGYEFLDTPGVVRLVLDIREGVRSRIGRITIRGNVNTQDRVLRRELRFYPGDDFNMLEARRAERRLRETSLFTRATVTPLADDDGVREALVEVEEGVSTDFRIGLGVSTDNGVLGTFIINNRNFDLFDWPRTWGELFRGQAFRGAGQRLRLQLEPGNDISQFRIGFTEPYLLDKPVRLDTQAYLFQRARESYDEERLGLTASLSRRFESGLARGWAVEGAIRAENIKIDNLRTLAANPIFRARGNTFLTSLKGSLVRDTTDSRFQPSEGYRLSLAWEQVGALGGDDAFGKPTASASWYRTLQTDALDRKSILALRADAGYIVGNAPVFERFYGGGFGSIRGFEFRGVSPRAGLFNDRVGGDFILLVGGEYSFPVYGENLRGVAFVDMGTVEEGLEITDWRASIGLGLRINVEFFGPIPIVLDWGIPIADGEFDDTRIFNFSFGGSF